MQLSAPHHHEVCMSRAAKNRAASPPPFSPSSLWEERLDSLACVWVSPVSPVSKGKQGSRTLKQYWSLPKLQQTDRETKYLHELLADLNGPEAALQSVASPCPGSGETNTSRRGTPWSQPLWAAENQPGLIATYLLFSWGLLHQK